MAKYMIGIPCTLADCVDSSMCPYNSYFPKMDCVLQICKNCGTSKLKAKIKKYNKCKMKDCRKWFLVKQWSTKSESKNGERSSYLAWDHLRLSFSDILDCTQNKSMECLSMHFLLVGIMCSINKLSLIFVLEKL